MPKKATTVHVVWKLPGAEPVPYELDPDDLETLQQLVDGYIESIRVGPKTVMWVNEEGKLRDMMPNIWHDTHGPILGPVVIADHDGGGEMTDMKPLDAATWMNWLRERAYKAS